MLNHFVCIADAIESLCLLVRQSIARHTNQSIEQTDLGEGPESLINPHRAL
jgi:hypothetical protein